MIRTVADLAAVMTEMASEPRSEQDAMHLVSLVVADEWFETLSLGALAARLRNGVSPIDAAFVANWLAERSNENVKDVIDTYSM